MAVRVAVTGASGLLGSAIAADLREHGHAVVGLGRSSQQGVVKVDLLDEQSILDAIEGVDVVVHAAGKVGAQGDDDVNWRLAENLGRAAGANYPVLNLSSVAVYGYTNGTIVTEATACKPAGDYGVAKLRAEQDLQAHAAAVCHLRIANVFRSEQLSSISMGWRQRLIRANEVTNLVFVNDVADLVTHLCKIGSDRWPSVVNVVRPDLGRLRHREIWPASPPVGWIQPFVPRQAAHLLRRGRRVPSLPNRTFSSAVASDLGFAYREIAQT